MRIGKSKLVQRVENFGVPSLVVIDESTAREALIPMSDVPKIANAITVAYDQDKTIALGDPCAVTIERDEFGSFSFALGYFYGEWIWK